MNAMTNEKGVSGCGQECCLPHRRPECDHPQSQSYIWRRVETQNLYLESTWRGGGAGGQDNSRQTELSGGQNQEQRWSGINIVPGKCPEKEMGRLIRQSLHAYTSHPVLIPSTHFHLVSSTVSEFIGTPQSPREETAGCQISDLQSCNATVCFQHNISPLINTTHLWRWI